MHIQYVSDMLLIRWNEWHLCCQSKLSRMTVNHVCHLLKWLKSIKYQFPQLINKLCRRIVQMQFIWELFRVKKCRPLKKVPHPIDRPAYGNPQQRTPLITDHCLDMSVQGKLWPTSDLQLKEYDTTNAVLLQNPLKKFILSSQNVSCKTHCFARWCMFLCCCTVHDTLHLRTGKCRLQSVPSHCDSHMLVP